jgi:hypothetical protein
MTPARRRALALIAGSALGALLPGQAFARPTRSRIKFVVLQNGQAIGHHTVSFERTGTSLRVSTAIDLEVRLRELAPFHFSHRGEERWGGNRLVELRGRTDENGERFEVAATLAGDALQIAAPNGLTVVAGLVFTNNDLWNRAALRSKTLVDAHHGGLVGIVSRAETEEEIVLGARKIAVSRFEIISPFFAGTIWYDRGNRWRKSLFELKGERVEYLPV